MNYFRSKRKNLCTVVLVVGLAGGCLLSAHATPKNWRSSSQLSSILARAIYPNPIPDIGYPDEFPGSNQIVLKKQASPIVVPAKISLEQGGIVTGLSSQVIDEYKNSSIWELDRPFPHALSQGVNDSELVDQGSASIYRTFTDSPNHLARGFGMDFSQDLPATNASFGERIVKFYVKNRLIDTAKVGLFYESVGTDHPDDTAKNYNRFTQYKTSNFFYYYMLALGDAPFQAPIIYDGTPGPGDPGDTDVSYDTDLITHEILRVYCNAASVSSRAHGNSLVQYFDYITENGVPVFRCVGFIPVSGIDFFAGVCCHESYHYKIAQMLDQHYKNSMANPYPSYGFDDDRDGIPNTEEALKSLDGQIADTAHYAGEHFQQDPQNPSVFHGFTGHADGDAEVAAYMEQENVLGPDGEDWADDGLHSDFDPTTHVRYAQRVKFRNIHVKWPWYLPGGTGIQPDHSRDN